MIQQQKQYAKDFLMEIYNQSSDLYTGDTTVDGKEIEMPHFFECLIELENSSGFTASYKHGVEWLVHFFMEVNEIYGREHINGYFALYILFYENETRLICEIVKDTENYKSNGGIDYSPVRELVYEKSINWRDLNDYYFQMQEYKHFKEAIQNKQF